MAVIYQITNMVNGKYYIGSAQSFERRVWQHKYDLRRGTHKNPRLQAAWNKYGEDAFVFEVIEQLAEGADQLLVEDMHLSQHVGRQECYNINSSAELPRLGQTLSDDAKAKLSRNRKGKHAGENHYRYGTTLNEETRKKIGDAQRGVKKAPRTFTPEGLERARENMKRNAKPQTPLEFVRVLAKFPQDVQDRYDFSNANYTGALNRITGCVCRVHGEFSQYAAQFRKGRGCPHCGAEQRSESKRKEMKSAWGTIEGRSTFMRNRRKCVDSN